MPTFAASDGTQLAYRTEGSGKPLVCLPGGPQDSAYLGDLGGLSAHRRLVLLDLRGTGESAVPSDPSTCRCDRMVDDVEALRRHLGLPHMDLLGHSAGANLAELYTARYPDQVSRLVLLTPSPRALNLTVTPDMRLATVQRREAEPWFPAAYAALEAITAGRDADEDAIAAFFYGRWDTAAQQHYAAASARRRQADLVARHFSAEGAFDPEATRAALSDYRSPVLVLGGEYDVNTPAAAVAELAALFPDATLVTQPGAGHYPWLDDAARFVATVTEFLG